MWILGPEWAGFHRMLLLLAPLFLARFLVESLWNVLVVHGQALFLAATAAQLLAAVASYGGVAAAGGPALLAVGLHSAGGTAIAVLTLAAIRRIARTLPDGTPDLSERSGVPVPSRGAGSHHRLR